MGIRGGGMVVRAAAAEIANEGGYSTQDFLHPVMICALAGFFGFSRRPAGRLEPENEGGLTNGPGITKQQVVRLH